MKRRRIALWALALAGALGVYLIFVVVFAPASWVARLAAQFSQDTIELSSTSGSAWDGQGELSLLPSPAARVKLGEIHWRIQPSALLLARLQGRLALKGLGGEAELALSAGRSRIELADLHGRFAAPDVSRLHAAAGLLEPLGRLEIVAKHLALAQESFDGAGELRWIEAGSARFGLRDLGDYRLAVNGNGRGADLTLTTERGDLELTGSGQWDALGSGRLKLAIAATPRARQSQIEPWLAAIAKQEAPGRYRLDLNTLLRLR